jgi:hypothetical protein
LAALEGPVVAVAAALDVDVDVARGAIAAGRFEQVIEIAHAFGEARSAAGR